MAHVGARGLLVTWLAASCNVDDEHGAAAPTGVGGDSGEAGGAGAPADFGGTGGSPDATSGGTHASGGGGTGATSAGIAGAAGAAGADVANSECRPGNATSLDRCEYPESLGGAGDSTKCGVTSGAWYPLGASELTTWPTRSNELGVELSGNDGVGPKVVLDPENRPIVGWITAGLEVTRWTRDAWEPLPTGTLARSDSSAFEIAVDNSGNPVVLEQYGTTMRVLRWGEEGWVSLGDWPADGEGRLALTAEDAPVVVYQSDFRIFAKRWNGTEFEDLLGDGAGGSLNQEAPDTPHALAVGQDGTVVVAWVEPLDAGTKALRVQQFDGERWDLLVDSGSGAGVATGAYITAPSVAVHESGEVIVTWGDDGPTDFVGVWDGSAWSTAGAMHSSADQLASTDLLRGPDGAVYLSGREYNEWSDDYREMLLMRREAGEWVPGPDPDVSNGQELALGHDGHFAVADYYHQGEVSEDYSYSTSYRYVQVSLNSNGAWLELDSPTAQGAGVPSGRAQEVVASADGWFLHDSKCRVAHWDGQAWLTTDLDAWRGNCNRSSLVESPTGELVLALWTEAYSGKVRPDDEGIYETSRHTLHVLAWTGEAWAPMSDAFQDYTLIDNFSIAFDAAGAPLVAWVYPTEGGYYGVDVIAWDGATWLEMPMPEDWNPRIVELATLPDNRLLAVWRDQDTRNPAEQFALYDGGQWQAVPELLRSDDTPFSTVHDTNGTPFLAWPTASDLVLYELAQSGWQRVAADEARLATLPASVRTHVFEDNGEVYLRRFENCSWRGVSASDRDGGISNSAEASAAPAAASYGGTTCVSWVEAVGKYGMQFVRCHD